MLTQRAEVLDGDRVALHLSRGGRRESRGSFDSVLQSRSTVPRGIIDAMPELNTKNPRFNGTFTNTPSTTSRNKFTEEGLRHRHPVRFGYAKIVTKLYKVGKASSIIL